MRDVGGALNVDAGRRLRQLFQPVGPRPYEVIPQVEQKFRLNADQLKNYYINTSTGSSIPLGTIAHFENHVAPESLNHFQQQNAATITAIPYPGTTTGDAIIALRQIATKAMPQGYSIDYAGETRQEVQESSALIITFFFALIIIFLTLSASSRVFVIH